MKKENGFTLVELLGVIAILALIIVVAAPPIVNQIKKSRSTFDKATLSLIYSAADLYVDNNQNDYPNINENTYCVTLDTLIKSGELKESIINIDKESEIAVDQTVKIVVNNNLYDYSVVEATQCEEYSAPSTPELSAGTIPIVYNGTNWIKADITSEWYNYSSKEWANAVLVTDASRVAYQSAAAGTVINEADVLVYLVWIPRYRYKLFNVGATSVTPQTIEVMFEDKWHSKANGSVDGYWLTHPAFTFGAEELNGFWVGKFETSGNATTPLVKPNGIILGSQNVATQFATAQNFNNTATYGTTSDFDSHMMKNMEWGAVAYLTQSIYGKNSELWKNNSSTGMTGCAGNSINEPAYSGCQNAYNTATGVNASTTGNIYGIYDMNGGAWEYVMGGMYNSDNTTIMVGLSGFEQAIIDSETMEKYINKYTYGTTYNDQDAYNRRQLGDATGETRGWNSDRDYFVTLWFIRGGSYGDTVDTGVFAFSAYNGPLSGITWRLVQLKP